jgi:CHAT domain-containing protein
MKGHADKWLSDYLASQPSSRQGKLLTSAILFNRKGDPGRAFHYSVQAAKSFHRSSNTAGEVRALLERLYALHRQSRASECEVVATELTQSLSRRDYSWIEIQVMLEHSICEAMLSNFSRSSEHVAEAQKLARKHNFPTLYLRAAGLEASLGTATGDLRLSWRRNEQGLAEYWADTYPSERAFQFYSDLEFSAEAEGLWHSAINLEKEAIESLPGKGHDDIKAIAHHRLGALAEILGNTSLAKQQFESANTLFAGLPANDATRSYEADAQISLAGLEIQHGFAADAEQRLRRAAKTVSKLSNFTIALRFYKAWARVEKSYGASAKEQQYLTKAIAIGNKGLKSLPSDRARWDWSKEVGDAYRRLVEIHSIQEHDPIRLLAEWEQYRNVEMQGFVRPTRAPYREQTLHLLRQRLGAMRDSTAVVFAVFPKHVLTWVADDRGVKEFRIAIGEAELQKRVEPFLEACSDPKYPIEKVNAQGRRLYELLLAPLGDAMGLRKKTLIEGDTTLSIVPWQALQTQNGKYLGQELDLEQISTLTYKPLPRGNARPKVSMLVVSPSSEIATSLALQPLSDADREAAAVAGIYHKSIELRGTKATKGKILAALVQTEAFHFAGHAETRERGGSLLVTGSNAEAAITARDLQSADLSSCKLAVLSACSTGQSQETARDPYGLVHALIAAGTHQVVASQWDVDSSTTRHFMEVFYDSYSRGFPVATSLRVAEKRLLDDPATIHPYYWAAFTVFASPTGLQGEKHGHR